MKIIILGDTHFGAYKSSEVYHNYFKKFFDSLFKYCVNNSIKTIIQTGDLYDYRKEVQFNTIHQTDSYFFSRIAELGIELITIVGNHDSVYKNTNRINSIRCIHPNDFQIVDMYPITMKFDNCSIDLYPWINDENISVCRNFLEKSNSQIGVGHFEFASFPLYPGVFAEHGADHKDFSKYERVFSGHYHTRSTKDNILYVGTPYELTWADLDDPKGFHVFDTETHETTFIRNEHTLHTKIAYSEGMSIDLDQIKDHYVKLIVSDKGSVKKFDAFVNMLESASPLDLKIIESAKIEKSDTECVTSAVLSTRSLLQSYIETASTSLDKSVLSKSVLARFAEAEQILNSL